MCLCVCFYTHTDGLDLKLELEGDGDLRMTVLNGEKSVFAELGFSLSLCISDCPAAALRPL